MEDYRTVYAKLLYIQGKLKVPKSQYSEFGDYNYRSCEDIQSAVKPFAEEVGAVCICSDEVVFVEGRWYVKATARLIDCESGNAVETYAYAGEEAEKKKLDKSQLTGVASSYARKYALGGLFQLDDTKDSDGLGGRDDNDKPITRAGKAEKKEPPKEPLTLEKAKALQFTSKGEIYTMGEMSDEYLRSLSNYTKMPKFAEAAKLILASRENGKG